jgi:cation transport regulator ChaC
MDYILYFAYGHNTDTHSMHHRAPGSKPLGVAVAPNYRMILRKFCDLMTSDGDKTYGVLYALPVSDIQNLDYDEDYHNHYDHTVLFVEYHGKLYKALTYTMTPGFRENNSTEKEYISAVRQGYRTSGLPMSQLTHAIHTHLNNN